MVADSSDERTTPPGANPVRLHQEQSPELLAYAVYRLYALQVTASGTPLALELSDVRTIPREEFGKVGLREVVTLFPEEWIRIDSHIHATNGEVAAVSFPARWSALSGADDPGPGHFDPTLQESFDMDLASGDEHALPVPDAVVAFRVAASLAGRSVSYRAYLILPEYDGTRPIGEFLSNDRVLASVPELLASTRLAVPLDEFERIRSGGSAR
ncbi:MAG TPA: hypothetical protein VLF66_04045 [Thermoanaerobaculia bacterium]|nr:hypothetical protein [Thermoanaerobaculia bacterium]